MGIRGGWYAIELERRGSGPRNKLTAEAARTERDRGGGRGATWHGVFCTATQGI